MLSALRLAAVCALASIGGIALANGAMGLGLEQWDMGYWLVYVLVTVAFEAFFIGRYLGLGATRSAAASIIGNLFTGLCCGGGGLCAPGLHMSFVGSAANPNPFFNAVALLTGFAIPSALCEWVVWWRFTIRTVAEDAPLLRATI